MANNILSVGHYEEDEERGFDAREFVRTKIPRINLVGFENVSDSLEALDSRNYRGIFIENLEISWGSKKILERYFKKLEVWKEEMSEPYGSGLYLARYALRENLPVLALTKTGGKRDLARVYPMTIVEYLPELDTFSRFLDKDEFIRAMRKTFSEQR